MLIENRRGNYSFIKGLGPYSAGAVAAAGYEVEHARLNPPLPLKAGFDQVSEHLKTLGRPRQALCGMELRSPRPFSFQGFADFNAGYINVLKSWDVFQDGINPVARTNVAPDIGGPSEAVLYGFSYTVARKQTGKRWPSTFVVAGAGELPEGSLSPNDVVRRGETSPDAIAEKARFVLNLMDGRLKELNAGWPDVTGIGIYTVHDVHPLMARLLLPGIGRAALHGLTWFYARPPIVTIEYEMDVRGCRREIVIQT